MRTIKYVKREEFSLWMTKIEQGKYLFVQSIERIVFAVTSCRIMVTLLQGGQTAHFILKLPVNLNRKKQPVSSIERELKMAKCYANMY